MPSLNHLNLHSSFLSLSIYLSPLFTSTSFNNTKIMSSPSPPLSPSPSPLPSNSAAIVVATTTIAASNLAAADLPVTVTVATDQPQRTPPTLVEPLPVVRKFPAPCWTQEETLALISAYQDKWYSLRRRNLRTADWEAVAEEVTRRCPDQTPAKTSAQCRHKMEKLRKRYRTEKQRILSLPHNHNTRFFGSSWIFFELMDALELGSGVSTIQTAINNTNANANNTISNNNVGKVVDLDVKPFSMNHMKNDNMIQNHNNNNNNSGKRGGDLGKYFDEILMSMGGNNSNNNNKGKSQNHEFHHDVAGRSPAPHIKFRVKNQQPQQQQQQGGYGDVGDDGYGLDEEYSGGRGRSSMSGGFSKRKYDDMLAAKMVPVNGGGGSSRKEGGNGQKLRRDAVVGEMVASIKMLGEGLVKMEKMKMDMMREIEKMRMEMEMKRSEMILESQHLIVNAFVQGLKKNKKVKAMDV